MKIPTSKKAIAIVDKNNPKISAMEIYNYGDESISYQRDKEAKAIVEIRFIKYINE